MGVQARHDASVQEALPRAVGRVPGGACHLLERVDPGPADTDPSLSSRGGGHRGHPATPLGSVAAGFRVASATHESTTDRSSVALRLRNS